MSDVTQILERVEKGDAKAPRSCCRSSMTNCAGWLHRKCLRTGRTKTLQPTALVHEAWLRLVGGPTQSWNNRQHFFRAAAEAMRHILVDRARQRRAQRHRGHLQQTELSETKAPVSAPDDELLSVHEALEHLALRDPVSANLVKLRYFAGLSMPDAAQALGIPLRTAERLSLSPECGCARRSAPRVSKRIGGVRRRNPFLFIGSNY